MAGTFGALAFGLQHFREGLPWAGVLANRVGQQSAMPQMLQARPARACDTWLGALPRNAALEPARAAPGPDCHLRGGLMRWQRLDAAADALAATPLGSMLAGRGPAALVLSRFDAPQAERAGAMTAAAHRPHHRGGA